MTPANKQSRAGNRTTTVRWARILRGLGHRVSVAVGYAGEPVDLMIARYAWRSAASVAAYRQRYPERPLVVALIGTDIYRFIDSHRETTLHSIEVADALVGLHDLVHAAIPRRFGAKLEVIYQSAPPLTTPRRPSRRHFDVCAIGHLRDQKDALRTALAARDLPPESRVRAIRHAIPVQAA